MGLRCVIVDDSEEFLVSAGRLLAAQGLEIVGSATSGIEALRLAQELLPDVALVDVELGEEDGLGVARQIGEAAPEVTVVLISTHPQDDLAELIAESTAIGFLPKTDLSATALAELVG